MENEWIVQNKKFLELAGQFSVEASEYESSSAEVRTNHTAGTLYRYRTATSLQMVTGTYIVPMRKEESRQ